MLSEVNTVPRNNKKNKYNLIISSSPTHLVVETEHVPSRVSWLNLQQPHVQPLEDVRLLELCVCPPDGGLQDPCQVVRVELGGRLTQLALKQV